MKLDTIINRQSTPQPWREGDNIPWNEPGFSQRMLVEHLSQAHDAASRRLEVIDRHTAWIHQTVMGNTAGRILDLGCGPGLYTSRLAELGHICLGIDYSPASIHYARQAAVQRRLTCIYLEQDLRQADFGAGFDLVMFIYGEFNVFCKPDAASILKKARRCLSPTGCLLLEVHTFEAVQRMGEQPATWYSSQGGLFSAQPHLVLEESHWEAALKTATQRYFIMDGETAAITRFAASYQAYDDEEYRSLLQAQGFEKVMFYPSLEGTPAGMQEGFFVILAQ